MVQELKEKLKKRDKQVKQIEKLFKWSEKQRIVAEKRIAKLDRKCKKVILVPVFTLLD